MLQLRWNLPLRDSAGLRPASSFEPSDGHSRRQYYVLSVHCAYIKEPAPCRCQVRLSFRDLCTTLSFPRRETFAQLPSFPRRRESRGGGAVHPTTNLYPLRTQRQSETGLLRGLRRRQFSVGAGCIQLGIAESPRPLGPPYSGFRKGLQLPEYFMSFVLNPPAGALKLIEKSLRKC